MFNVWAFFSSVSACGTVRCAGQQLRRFPCVVCVLAVSLQSPKCCCGHVFCSVLAGHSHYCQCWKSCETHFLQCKVCATAESCTNGYITGHLFQVGRKLLSSNVFSAAWRKHCVFGVLVLNIHSCWEVLTTLSLADVVSRAAKGRTMLLYFFKIISVNDIEEKMHTAALEIQAQKFWLTWKPICPSNVSRKCAACVVSAFPRVVVLCMWGCDSGHWCL